MTRKRQDFNQEIWQSITNADYDDVMANRNLYYNGIKNKETRQACKIYKMYRGKMKYKNKKTMIDGIVFDSQKEAKRYQVLKDMQDKGLISGLTLQEQFHLIDGVKIAGETKKRPSVRYIADFVYINNKTGEQVVEDVKSAITRKDKVYRLKKHLMKIVHDIDVVEV